MQRATKLWLCAAAALVLLACACQAAEGDKYVRKLTSKDFHDVVNKHKLVIVKFYAPWCGHCKRMAPDYEAAAKALAANEDIVLGDVDCTVEEDLGEEFDIKGYPTLKYFLDGEVKDYTGGRAKDDFVKFATRLTRPAVSTVADVDAFNAQLSEAGVVVIGLFETMEGEAYTVLHQAAESLRDSNVFLESTSADIAKALNVASLPAIVLVKENEESLVYEQTAAMLKPDLVKWVKLNSGRLVDEIGQQNFKHYYELGLPTFIMFVPREQKSDLLKWETSLARTFRGQLSFVWADSEMNKPVMKNMGLSGNVAPAIVISNFQKRSNFVYDETAAVEETLVAQWLHDFVEGKVSQNMKSQPIPEANGGPVKIVVGKTFQKLVMDPTKNVLVKFYAPWCGHCKAMAPTYEELGQHFMGDENIVVAKIDATENDVPSDYEVSGFPTIKFFPAGETKAQAIDYQGDRTLNDMIKFIEQNRK